MTKRLLFTLLFSAFFLNAFSQFYPTQYRPGGLNWQQLKTPDFMIVFPAGEDSAAWRSARILQAQYNKTKELTGGSLDNFPLILTNYNDRSNGFVTSLHFRSEIDIHNFKGKSLSPRSGNWLETVAPHELVHAAQFNNTGTYGLGAFVNIFSPDLARSFHGAIPAGFTEGLATYHESTAVVPGGGRGNLPFFANQFDAHFNSSRRWSLGQMSHFPERTRPFDRHYMGGYEFTSWLHQNFGESTSKEAIDFYINYPFLGYGIALLHATGKWPGQLYNQFEKDKDGQFRQHKKSYSRKATLLPVSFQGAQIRRPLWLNLSTLIFYGSFYNARPGFYTYNIDTQEISLVAETSVVQDFIYSLSADRKKLLFSYYKSSPMYDNTFTSRLAELDLADNNIHTKKDTKGLYAPLYDSGKILALNHYHDSNQLVFFAGGRQQVLAGFGADRIIHVSINPKDNEQLAVVVNKRGLQALWLARRSSVQQDLQAAPAISFSRGSVYDPVWHPAGDKLLFTADINGSMNIYEYDTEQKQVTQQTNTRYNSYEASYNFDGSKIAYTQQVINESFAAVLPRKDFYTQPLSASLWQPSKEKAAFMQRPELGRQTDIDTGSWESSSYSSGVAWLKPRIILPLVEEVSNQNIYEVGIGLHSNNLLQNQSYSLDLSYVQNRFWYDLTYRNKQFFPGFEARIFSDPSFRALRAIDPAGNTTIFTFLSQQRRASLSIPTRFVLENNVRFSSFFIEPEIRYSQFRFFGLNNTGEPASNFADRTSANFFSSFSYKLQQNIRDIQPNSGITLFSELNYAFSSEELIIQTPQIMGRLPLSKPYALRAGFFSYLAPLKRWNQSLRIGLQGTTQSGLVFDNQSFISDGFSEPIFPLQTDLLSFSTRYTIPLIYPDNGGLLLPLYLSDIYLVAFSNTVSQYNEPNIINASRTVFGGGIRFQFRISNLALDIGFGYGYEPTRNNSTFFIGNF